MRTGSFTVYSIGLLRGDFAQARGIRLPES